jgi:hypothetical protein
MTRRLAALTLALGVVTSIPTPTMATSEGVVFGEPVAGGSFGETIAFSTRFVSATVPTRVELLVARSGGEVPRVEVADVASVGPDTWEAAVYQGGHVVPNTEYEYRFRVVTDDGDVLGPMGMHRIDDTRIDWRRLEGETVTVWWHEGDREFAERALGIAEEALASAAELLGVDEVEHVDFFIYADDREFREAMGPAVRENLGGQAHVGIRTLFALIGPRQVDSGWVDEVVTHELAHLVFHAAVDNPYQYPPTWLNEGLAVYLSRGYSNADRTRVEGAAGSGTIIPLDGLSGLFPTRPTRISLSYSESVSAVDHFIETYGQDRLIELITSFADGIGTDAAFVAATGEDLAAFDDAWLASIGAERPEAYGPQESEPGAVPDAWADPTGALLG